MRRRPPGSSELRRLDKGLIEALPQGSTDSQKASEMVITIGTRLYDMLLDDDLTDITFVVQGTEIKAHRVVASSHGGVLKELVKQKDGAVDLGEEIAPRTFLTVLQYLYTDTFDVSEANIFEMLHAACTLRLQDLEQYCAGLITPRLTNTNILAYFEQALHLESKETMQICHQYIKTSANDIISSKEFMDISYQALLAMCEVEDGTYNEITMFCACVEWARKKCEEKKQQGTPEDLRKALGDIVKKIRFSSMTYKQFKKTVIPTKILTFEEVGRTIYELKAETTTNISTRDMKVQVNISGILGVNSTAGRCPLSTTISALKKLAYPMYNECYYELSYEGRKLQNNSTLDYICTPGEDLELEVYSVNVIIFSYARNWEIPVEIWRNERDRAEDVMKCRVFIVKGIPPTAQTLYTDQDFKHKHFHLHKLTPAYRVGICYVT